MTEYLFKREPREHQNRALAFIKDKKNFALFARMRTGKSKVTLDHGVHLYLQKKIEAIVIVAPNGVHAKWIHDDVPNDIHDSIVCETAIWRSGNKRAIEECEDLMNPGSQLRVLAMNVEAFQFDGSPAEKFLIRFLKKFDCMLVVDESHTICNPKAKRTQRLIKLGGNAPYRSILTGTPADNPLNIYSQFKFLDDSIFGQSYVSFQHTFAEILPDNHPTIIAIKARGARFTPTLVAKDEQGRPKYKNLDKLREQISPYTFTCRLEDCTDLPDTVYSTMYYELEKTQRRVYDELASKAKIEFQTDSVTVVHKMTLLLRLQQVLSGFVPSDTGELIRLFEKIEDNPRIKSLMTFIESEPEEQMIIWCRFNEEVEQIASLLGEEAVTHYGKTKDRELSKRLFKEGKARYMIGSIATGGVGLDFSGSYIMVFYSNTFAYKDRDQAMARQQFVGQKRNILVVDLEAEDSVDQKFVKSLRDKQDIAAQFFKL